MIHDTDMGDEWNELLSMLRPMFMESRREAFQIRNGEDMDHLEVLRNKIGHLRVEIAAIQELNQQFRRDGENGIDVLVAHGRRSERLQGIQHELVQLDDLGRRVVSTEQLREKHRSRLHPAKQKRAA
jgi:hypothetical protein